VNRARALIVPVVTTLCCAALWFGVLHVQNRLTEARTAFVAPASMAFVPHSEKIRPYLLGFHTAYADYLWIRTTLYFGSHYMTDRKYEWLVHMVDLVTRLHPNFYPAYEFAGLMLPDVCRNPDAARIILERGVSSNVEKKWKLYYFLGMVYFRYYDDKQTAALCMTRAVTQPNAPGYKLAGIAAAMFKKAGRSEEGREFLDFMYSTSENPEVKRYILNKIKQY
jgi:hypothetical protein